MFVRVPGMTHCKLNLAKARGEFAELDLADVYSGHVISPVDVVATEHMRDIRGVRVGRSTLTDVFLIGDGEPPLPHLTQIGGKPAWPKGKAWPRNSDGAPHVFIAQFNFSDSQDIFPGLPGDLLVISREYWHDNWSNSTDKLRFHWLSSSSELESCPEKDVGAEFRGTYWGVIHRMQEWGDAEYGEREKHPDCCSVLSATKIGGLPYWIQKPPADRQPRGQLLCQISGLVPDAEITFPWGKMNEPPASLEDDGEVDLFGGLIYIFMDGQGQLAYDVQYD